MDGIDIDLWVQFVDYISQRPGQTVTLLVERDGREIELTSAIARFDTTITNFRARHDGRVGANRRCA